MTTIPVRQLFGATLELWPFHRTCICRCLISRKTFPQLVSESSVMALLFTRWSIQKKSHFCGAIRSAVGSKMLSMMRPNARCRYELRRRISLARTNVSASAIFVMCFADPFFRRRGRPLGCMGRPQGPIGGGRGGSSTQARMTLERWKNFQWTRTFFVFLTERRPTQLRYGDAHSASNPID